MAVQKLFGNRIPPACRICENATHVVAGDDTALCEKKGVVAGGYHCRQYVYDPLKREPDVLPLPEAFREEDFSL